LHILYFGFWSFCGAILVDDLQHLIALCGRVRVGETGVGQEICYKSSSETQVITP
jgi:hypothetical protein